MRGHIHKRGDRWTYVVDIGRDPITSPRRQRTKGGFPTRRDAEEALVRVQNPTVTKPDRWLVRHPALH